MQITRKLIALTVLLGALATGTGCTEVERRGSANFGVKQLFVSQAGLCNNKVLVTTGKVNSSTQSDGFSMIDARADKLVRVAGDAIIVDATPEQINTYIKANSLKEAQERLNQLIQDDGTIMKQPASCQNPK